MTICWSSWQRASERACLRSVSQPAGHWPSSLPPLVVSIQSVVNNTFHKTGLGKWAGRAGIRQYNRQLVSWKRCKRRAAMPLAGDEWDAAVSLATLIHATELQQQETHRTISFHSDEQITMISLKTSHSHCRGRAVQHITRKVPGDLQPYSDT